MNNPTTQKIEIELPAKFLTEARRLGRPVKWLAQLACEMFADDPPKQVIVAGPLERLL
jgi:hypothetical protein